ncbi:small acidic protein family-domain-containing protein [Umbelopsis sp. PMI_123]|nr:small acidic protein family-domain-containing protein [Umbelopsis sp. PMI_123]
MTEDKPKKQKKDKKVKKDKKEKKEKKAKKEKDSKDKKEKKRKHESDSENEATPVKKLATPTEAPSAAAAEESNSGRWNDWTKASFGGDNAQKNKFLRLLGAKKGSSTTSSPQTTLGESSGTSHSAIDAGFSQKMNQDLEKQFQDGLKMRKQQYGGKRGGLGWS